MMRTFAINSGLTSVWLNFLWIATPHSNAMRVRSMPKSGVDMADSPYLVFSCGLRFRERICTVQPVAAIVTMVSAMQRMSRSGHWLRTSSPATMMPILGGKKKKVSLLRKKSLVSLMWSTLMTLKQSNSSKMSIPRIFPGMGISTYRCRRSPARQIPNMTIN